LISRLALGGAALVGIASAVAYSASCSSETGATPSCIQDEDDAGHHETDGGCSPDPRCVDPDAGFVIEHPTNNVALRCCANLPDSGASLSGCLDGIDAVCTDNTGKEIDAKTCCQPSQYIYDAGLIGECMKGFHAKCFDSNGKQLTDSKAVAKQCCAMSGNVPGCLQEYGFDNGAGGGSTSSASSTSSTSSSTSSSTGSGGAGGH
jgi:hypothetical protein